MTHTVSFFMVIGFFYLLSLLLLGSGRPGWGRALLVVGLVLNGGFLIQHARITGVFISNALVEPAFFTPLVMGLVLLLLTRRRVTDSRALVGAIVLLLGAVLFAAFYPKGIIPPAANKSGVWPFLFFLTENSAYALFGLSGFLAAFSAPWAGGPDKTIRRLVILGFVAFSIAQVVGAYWSFLGWGHPFMWGSRHLSSAAVWLIFAALIHLRFLPTFPVPERWLTAAGGALALYMFYAHMVFERAMPRVGV